MANIDMAVLNTAITLSSDGIKSTQSFAPKSSGGTGIDLTAATFVLTVAQNGQAMNGPFAVATATPAIISSSAGALVLALGSGGSVPPGNYNYELDVTPASGTQQILAQGSCRVI
jgi:hypothetical protein